MKHFIDLTDFNKQQLNAIINNAIKLKKQYKQGVINNILKHKTLAMIFDKQSTRTRVSFEAGMTQLDGNSLFLSSADSQLNRGESIADSAKVISSMVDCVALRISSHKQIQEFAKNSSVPVINALSDKSHPCQLLADLMTFREIKGDITNKTISWIGDDNNMCNSYKQAAQIFDFKLNIAYIEKNENAIISNNIELFNNAADACIDADLIVTDVWTSMGQKNQQKDKTLFNKYKVTNKLINLAKKDVIFMHCLPAHRGEEVSSEVIDGKASVVFLEAENRLHAQKALLLYLLQ